MGNELCAGAGPYPPLHQFIPNKLRSPPRRLQTTTRPEQTVLEGTVHRYIQYVCSHSGGN